MKDRIGDTLDDNKFVDCDIALNICVKILGDSLKDNRLRLYGFKML